MRHLIRCAFFSLLFAGCHEGIYLGDDEGGATATEGDRLSQPYAAGTALTLSAHNLEGSGWALVSDDPSLLEISEQHLDKDELTATARALGPGEAHVHLVDDSGAHRRDARLTIKLPDHARTFSHAALRLLGEPSDSPDTAETAEAQVLIGGTGVFAVGYFAGSERLYGHGLLGVDTLPGVDVQAKSSSGLPINEWVFVTPSATGTTPIALRAGSVMLGSLSIVAVPDTDVTSVALELEDRVPSDGDEVWVAARARDAAQHDVFGAYSGWTLDGVIQTGKDDEAKLTHGDLYRFKYDGDAAPRALVATHGAATASVQVKASDGYVRNTTYLGCSAAPGTAEAGSIYLGLVLLGALVALRRRAATVVASAS